MQSCLECEGVSSFFRTAAVDHPEKERLLPRWREPGALRRLTI